MSIICMQLTISTSFEFNTKYTLHGSILNTLCMSVSAEKKLRHRKFLYFMLYMCTLDQVFRFQVQSSNRQNFPVTKRVNHSTDALTKF